MKIKRAPQHATYDSIKAIKKEITPDRAERLVMWQKDGVHIYTTCPACSAISNIKENTIDINGTVMPCVICVNCQTHYFLKLMDWDGMSKVLCERCGKVSYLKAGDLDKEGWTVYNHAPCSCCTAHHCPKCSSKSLAKR